MFDLGYVTSYDIGANVMLYESMCTHLSGAPGAMPISTLHLLSGLVR